MTKKLASKPVVEKYVDSLYQECQELRSKGIIPQLKVFLVGEHAPSLIYTRHKKKFCERIGASCEILHYADDVTEEKLKSDIRAQVEDPQVHGCFVQLPLPEHLSNFDAYTLIPPEKDVDGFHPYNVDAVVRGPENSNALFCCTPKGVMTTLAEYDIPIASKHAVIVGRSMIVGKPMGLMLLNANATVTYCHSKTHDLREHLKRADIIVSAIGRPKIFGVDDLSAENKPVIIDVGMNKDENGELCGDWDYEAVFNHCQAITPVPGGVGPMTILTLAQNLLKSAQNSAR